jgi:3-oxoadipate enol-lactonase
LTIKKKSEFFISQGEKFFYRSYGQGLPILLLHAGIADGRMWQPQINSWGQDFHLIVPDLRGFGRSPIPNGPFSYYEDLVALINHLDVKPVWLVGTSFGSRVALDLYLAHPDLVRGLVLVSPVVSGFEPDETMQAFGQEEDRLFEAGDLQAATELNMRMWLDGPHRSPDQVDPQVREMVAAMQLQAFQMPEPENAAVIELDPPAINRLNEVRVPTLIIAGLLDVAAIVSHAKMLAQAITGAQLELVSEAAHLPNMERPILFNAQVQQFIARADNL